MTAINKHHLCFLCLVAVGCSPTVDSGKSLSETDAGINAAAAASESFLKRVLDYPAEQKLPFLSVLPSFHAQKDEWRLIGMVRREDDFRDRPAVKWSVRQRLDGETGNWTLLELTLAGERLFAEGDSFEQAIAKGRKLVHRLDAPEARANGKLGMIREALQRRDFDDTERLLDEFSTRFADEAAAEQLDGLREELRLAKEQDAATNGIGKTAGQPD